MDQMSALAVRYSQPVQSGAFVMESVINLLSPRDLPPKIEEITGGFNTGLKSFM